MQRKISISQKKIKPNFMESACHFNIVMGNEKVMELCTKRSEVRGAGKAGGIQ